jgi:hypothetical protein
MIELRSSDWGRAPSSPVARESHTASSQLSNHHPQMGVYYGPDGQALTAEETEFLDQGINRHDEEEEYEYVVHFQTGDSFKHMTLIISYFSYAYEEDTGMDDEMAEAFEKFLMMQETLK